MSIKVSVAWVILVGLQTILSPVVKANELIIAGERGGARVQVEQLSLKGQIVYSESVSQELNAIRDRFSRDQRAEHKYLVLDIDSPGGATMPSFRILQELREIKTMYGVRIYTYVPSMAASGGYLIALAGDGIFAHEFAEVIGHIGVVVAAWDFVPFFEQFHISKFVAASSPAKSAGASGYNRDPVFRKMIEENIARTNHRFVNIIKASRGGRVKAIDDFKVNGPLNGRSFDAEQALELGLIDASVASYQDVMMVIQAEVANVTKGERAPTIRFKDRFHVTTVDMSKDAVKGGFLSFLMQRDILSQLQDVFPSLVSQIPQPTYQPQLISPEYMLTSEYEMLIRLGSLNGLKPLRLSQ